MKTGWKMIENWLKTGWKLVENWLKTDWKLIENWLKSKRFPKSQNKKDSKLKFKITQILRFLQSTNLDYTKVIYGVHRHILPDPAHLDGVVRSLDLVMMGVAVQALHPKTVPQVPRHVGLQTAAAEGLPVDPPAGPQVAAVLVDLYPDRWGGQELEAEVCDVMEVVWVLESVLGNVANEVAGRHLLFDLVAEVDRLGSHDDRFVAVVDTGDGDDEDDDDDDVVDVVVVVVAPRRLQMDGGKMRWMEELHFSFWKLKISQCRSPGFFVFL